MNKDSLFVYEEDGFCELKYSFKDLKRLERKNQKLHNNWNELKKFIKEYPSIRYSSIEKVDGIYLSGKLIREDNLLDKMQELERGEEWK